MPEEIYHLNEIGDLQPMKEAAYKYEDDLQNLVAQHPELLSGEQMNPDNPRRWILVDREFPISDVEGGSERWSIDHLFIDQDAVLTLVETKLSRNSEIRRKIVGQMMEYAAHATQTLSSDRVRQVFEDRCEDKKLNPSELIGTLLQSDDEPDVDEFWERVDANLRLTRLRLLFVADGIPTELGRIVEFLNEQMPHTEVLAVEIKQFKGVTGKTLVPRVIGRTASAVERKSRKRSKKSVEQVLAEMPTDGARAAAQRLLDIAKANGAIIAEGDAGVTIRWRNRDWSKQHHTLVWIYPTNEKVWLNTRSFTFGMNDWGFEEAPSTLRETLINWVKQLDPDVFPIDASTTAQAPDLSGNLTEHVFARAVTIEDAFKNIDEIAPRFEKVLKELNALAS